MSRNRYHGLYDIDSDGRIVREGDSIHFIYGIPPIRANGTVINRNGVLWALVPGHKPNESTLSDIRKYCEHFWKD